MSQLGKSNHVDGFKSVTYHHEDPSLVGKGVESFPVGSK